jgi:uroporphyrin-III C-methyltransferase
MLAMNRSAGFAYIVGAGPGDPELLTIKATKAIAKADVILMDDLVDPACLQYAKPNVRVQAVGKRGGCVSTPQSFIEKLMIREALAGNVVVRLKGGDPTVFGRLGEEMIALEAAGVAFEIVSGISSAVAAAAACKLSLTHRDHSHGVVFVTGHEKPGGNPADIGMLVKTGLTVAVYMGLVRAEKIVAQLLDQGCKALTPVTIVQGVSTLSQKIISTNLGHIPQALKKHSVASPAIIIIGEVTRKVVQKVGQQGGGDRGFYAPCFKANSLAKKSATHAAHRIAMP